jgi:pilus assembly protein Flp/PilA
MLMRTETGVTNMDRLAAISSVSAGGLSGFARDESGATAIEYALIASGISIVIVTAVNTVGTTTNGLFQAVVTAFNGP